MIQKRLNSWVNDHYEWLKREISKNIANGKMNEFAEDLTHHIIIDLYKMDPAKIEGLLDNGKLKWYCLRGAALQIKSSTSPFYITHRKSRMSARSGMEDTYTPLVESNAFSDEEDGLQECLDRAVSQLDWYLKALWEKKFQQHWTLEDIHKHYNIGKRHLIKDLNKAISEIRDVCKDSNLK